MKYVTRGLWLLAAGLFIIACLMRPACEPRDTEDAGAARAVQGYEPPISASR